MLKDRTRIKKMPKQMLKRLDEIQKEMNGPGKVKAGLPKDSSAYPDGTSVVMVAIAHEFGLGVPERSFVRSTVFEHRRKYLRRARKYGELIAKGKMSAEKALRLLGLEAQSDIRQKIVDIKEPPLVYREGNPLYDTGHMLESVTYQIGDGE